MSKKLTHLDLFSGIGGFSLGLEATGGFRTIGFSEIDPWCCGVLKKHWPKVKNYGDVRTIPRIKCDILTGGFPCQPFSSAGEQRGAEDDRHLWPSMCDVIALCRPTWCICENVPGIIPMELDNCCADLEDIGYTPQPIIVPACAVDAKHKRSRVWIIAHCGNGAFSTEQKQQSKTSGEEIPNRRRSADANFSRTGFKGNDSARDSCAIRQPREFREAVSDAQRIGWQTSGPKQDKTQTTKVFGCGNKKADGHTARELPPRTRKTRNGGSEPTNPSRWSIEPGICRVVHGIPDLSHRLKALGNSIVPQIAQIFGEIILKIERQ